MKTHELKATVQNSYYRKAYVLEYDKSHIYLQSYDTIVCGLINGNFIRLWDGYSVTTQNHINDFRQLFDLDRLSKKEWDSTPLYNMRRLALRNRPFKKVQGVNMGNQKYGFPVF